MTDQVRSRISKAGNVGKPRPLFIHGKLLEITGEYYKWADKDANKNKIEGTGGKVSYEAWVRLPDGKKGEKWFISVDQRMFRPDFTDVTSRGVMVDFEQWTRLVLPGILDAVGKEGDSVQTFLDRANSETWFVEAELVFTGEFYNDKPQHVIKPLRMTQDENVIRAWHKERYPKGEEQVPEEKLNQAKFIWTRMAKGDKDKFNTAVNDDADLSQYLVQFSANDYQLVKG